MARILVAEDDKYLNKLLSDQLMLRGHEVVSVLDGEIAWKQLLVHEDFEIVVLDMLLPRKMGAEVLAELRQLNRPSEPRIVAISGVYKNDSEIQEISALYQISEYLKKPFSIDDFIAAVEDGEKTNSAPFVFEGRLEETSIEVLLLKAYRSGLTGVFVLERDGITRRIYLSNGFPVSAESTSLAENLGNSLVALKIIDAATKEEASRRMVEERLQFGQMLVRMKAITDDGLFAGIRRHIQRLLLKVFVWREGHYRFDKLESLPKHIMHLEFNPLLLALKAHKAIYSSDLIQSLFETKLDNYCKYSAELGQILPLLNLEDTALAFFEQLPGDKILREILAPISQEHRETLLRIFYLLENTGLISWADKPVQNEVHKIRRADFTENFATAGIAHEAATKELQSEYIALLNKDHFEIFNLTPESSTQELDEAYRSLRYRLHPDRFDGGLGGEGQRILDDMLGRIDQAYQILSNAESRAHYLQSIQRFREDSLAESKKFLEAQDLFRQGLDFLRLAKFAEAKDSFLKAHKIWNQTIEYQLYAHYADFKLLLTHGSTKSTQAIEALKDQVQKNRSSDLGFLLLGHAHSALEQRDLARDAYKMALKINENNEEAQLALGKISEAKFKEAKASNFVKAGQKHSRPIVFGLMLIIGFAVAYVIRDQLTREPGIEEIDVKNWASIMPAVSARKKGTVVKVVLKDNWIETVPDPVLIGKCNEILNSLSSHAIMDLILSDSQKLKASCKATSMRRYDR